MNFDLEVDERGHAVEDSGRHEVDPAPLDRQDLELGERLQAGRDSGEPAVDDVQLLQRLSDQAVKRAVADVLKGNRTIASKLIF